MEVSKTGEDSVCASKNGKEEISPPTSKGTDEQEEKNKQKNCLGKRRREKTRSLGE